MDHPRAEGKLMAGRVRISHRIRPDAQIAAVEIVGNRPGDIEIDRGDLLADGRVITIQIRVFGLAGSCCSGHGCISFRSIAIGIPVSNQ